MKPVSNPASALGEAVGKLIESSLIEIVKQEVIARNFGIESARLKNGSENTYQIDAIVFDQNKQPVMLIESKYIRYKKHNRDMCRTSQLTQDLPNDKEVHCSFSRKLVRPF